jgi:hypothetical protein
VIAFFEGKVGMVRRPRVEVEGGLFHVYNRVASGEPIFLDPNEAVEFIETIRISARLEEVGKFGRRCRLVVKAAWSSVPR